MNVKFEKPKKNRQGVPVKRESCQREWDPGDVTKNNDPAALINAPLQMFTLSKIFPQCTAKVIAIPAPGQFPY